MAGFSIREYSSRDYHVVRELFAQGMLDYIPGAAMFLLKVPLVYSLIFTSVITLQLVYRSYLLSLLGFGAYLVGGRCLISVAIRRFIKRCHNRDLLNIEESYMKKPNSCLWVAESHGRIVGMVGVQPDPNCDTDMIMRRMSVSKDQRRRGIARALCMTVIDFARQRKYQRVTLDTSTIQVHAHKLYQRMGFRISKVISSRIGRVVGMTRTFYSYDV
ncbi:probable N-acetyltransferase camello isoform X2 [Hyperolius riggenbachi]